MTPKDEYDGLAMDVVHQHMQDIWDMIHCLIKKTNEPDIQIDHEDQKHERTYTYTRDDRVAKIKVKYTHNQSTACIGWQEQNQTWLKMTEFADVRAFVVRRLAPRICICLSTNDMLNLLGHIASQKSPSHHGQSDQPVFTYVPSKLEHIKRKSYFVFYSGGTDMDRTAVRVWLEGDDLLKMQRYSHASAQWTDIECITDEPIVMDAKALSEADDRGDFQEIVQITWGQIMQELGLNKLLLHTDALPKQLQSIISDWKEEVHQAREAEVSSPLTYMHSRGWTNPHAHASHHHLHAQPIAVSARAPGCP